MKQILPLLILVLTCTASKQLQSQSSLNLITIQCSAESQDVLDALTKNPSAGAWPVETLDGYCFKDVIDRLEKNLQLFDIHLTVLQKNDASQADSQSLIDLYTTMTINGAPLVSITPLKNPMSIGQFPFLASHPTSEIGLYVVGSEAKLATADFVTGILLYSLGRCDLALPFFDATERNAFYWYTYIESGQTPIPRAYARFYKGNCLILQQDYQAAIRYFEAAFPVESEQASLLNIEIQANRAWSYLQFGNEQKAFEVINDAVKEAKDLNSFDLKVKAVVKRAQLYALISDYDAAIADMNAVIEIDSDNLELYILRGQYLRNQYEWDRALEDFDHAIELDPDYAPAYFERGLLYYSILQTGVSTRDEALTDFEHYLELAPDGEYAEQAATYITQIEAAIGALEE